MKQNYTYDPVTSLTSDDLKTIGREVIAIEAMKALIEQYGPLDGFLGEEHTRLMNKYKR